MILSWSVFLWPVAFAAMSESTTSAPPPSISCSTCGACAVEEVELAELDTRDRRHVEDVDRHHLAAALRGADPLRRDLAPAAGRGAEIDHAAARLEQAILVVDLDQLVGGARAQALAPGARHIGVVELAFEPALLRDRAVLLRLEPHRQRPLVARRGHGACRGAQTSSARISSTSMPSRSPRSATRSRSHGNTRRIASRMAQPASTRSARSAPMQGLATRSS